MWWVHSYDNYICETRANREKNTEVCVYYVMNPRLFMLYKDHNSSIVSAV